MLDQWQCWINSNVASMAMWHRNHKQTGPKSERARVCLDLGSIAGGKQFLSVLSLLKARAAKIDVGQSVLLFAIVVGGGANDYNRVIGRK